MLPTLNILLRSPRSIQLPYAVYAQYSLAQSTFNTIALCCPRSIFSCAVHVQYNCLMLSTLNILLRSPRSIQLPYAAHAQYSLAQSTFNTIALCCPRSIFSCAVHVQYNCLMLSTLNILLRSPRSIQLPYAAHAQYSLAQSTFNTIALCCLHSIFSRAVHVQYNCLMLPTLNILSRSPRSIQLPYAVYTQYSLAQSTFNTIALCCPRSIFSRAVHVQYNCLMLSTLNILSRSPRSIQLPYAVYTQYSLAQSTFNTIALCCPRSIFSHAVHVPYNCLMLPTLNILSRSPRSIQLPYAAHAQYSLAQSTFNTIALCCLHSIFSRAVHVQYNCLMLSTLNILSRSPRSIQLPYAAHAQYSLTQSTFHTIALCCPRSILLFTVNAQCSCLMLPNAQYSLAQSTFNTIALCCLRSIFSRAVHVPYNCLMLPTLNILSRSPRSIQLPYAAHAQYSLTQSIQLPYAAHAQYSLAQSTFNTIALCCPRSIFSRAVHTIALCCPRSIFSCAVHVQYNCLMLPTLNILSRSPYNCLMLPTLNILLRSPRSIQLPYAAHAQYSLAQSTFNTIALCCPRSIFSRTVHVQFNCLMLPTLNILSRSPYNCLMLPTLNILSRSPRSIQLPYAAHAQYSLAQSTFNSIALCCPRSIFSCAVHVQFNCLMLPTLNILSRSPRSIQIALCCPRSIFSRAVHVQYNCLMLPTLNILSRSPRSIQIALCCPRSIFSRAVHVQYNCLMLSTLNIVLRSPRSIQLPYAAHARYSLTQSIQLPYAAHAQYSLAQSTFNTIALCCPRSIFSRAVHVQFNCLMLPTLNILLRSPRSIQLPYAAHAQYSLAQSTFNTIALCCPRSIFSCAVHVQYNCLMLPTLNILSRSPRSIQLPYAVYTQYSLAQSTFNTIALCCPRSIFSRAVHVQYNCLMLSTLNILSRSPRSIQLPYAVHAQYSLAQSTFNTIALCCLHSIFSRAVHVQYNCLMLSTLNILSRSPRSIQLPYAAHAQYSLTQSTFHTIALCCPRSIFSHAVHVPYNCLMLPTLNILSRSPRSIQLPYAVYTQYSLAQSTFNTIALCCLHSIFSRAVHVQYNCLMLPTLNILSRSPRSIQLPYAVHAQYCFSLSTLNVVALCCPTLNILSRSPRSIQLPYAVYAQYSLAQSTFHTIALCCPRSIFSRAVHVQYNCLMLPTHNILSRSPYNCLMLPTLNILLRSPRSIQLPYAAHAQYSLAQSIQLPYAAHAQYSLAQSTFNTIALCCPRSIFSHAVHTIALCCPRSIFSCAVHVQYNCLMLPTLNILSRSPRSIQLPYAAHAQYSLAQSTFNSIALCCPRSIFSHAVHTIALCCPRSIFSRAVHVQYNCLMLPTLNILSHSPRSIQLPYAAHAQYSLAQSTFNSIALCCLRSIFSRAVHVQYKLPYAAHAQYSLAQSTFNIIALCCPRSIFSRAVHVQYKLPYAAHAQYSLAQSTFNTIALCCPRSILSCAVHVQYNCLMLPTLDILSRSPYNCLMLPTLNILLRSPRSIQLPYAAHAQYSLAQSTFNSIALCCPRSIFSCAVHVQYNCLMLSTLNILSRSPRSIQLPYAAYAQYSLAQSTFNSIALCCPRSIFSRAVHVQFNCLMLSTLNILSRSPRSIQLPYAAHAQYSLAQSTFNTNCLMLPTLNILSRSPRSIQLPYAAYAQYSLAQSTFNTIALCCPRSIFSRAVHVQYNCLMLPTLNILSRSPRSIQIAL